MIAARLVLTDLGVVGVACWAYMWGWAHSERRHAWDIPMIFGFIDPQFSLDQLTIEVEDE